jgi:uncharacterized protein (TIGR02996 family)
MLRMQAMNDEAAFLRAMQEHPDDASMRLVFSDWLEERGDARCELIRLLHTLTQSVEVPDRAKLEDRLRNLLESGVKPVGPFWTNSIGIKFAWIPAGTFLMGSPEGEAGQGYDEPQHKVTLTRGFWLAIHPVTQASWRAVMGDNPSEFHGDDLPVERVSWDACQEFLRKLSERDGPTYHLPTEAQWEYACRAGTTTPYYFGNTISTDQANFDCDLPYFGQAEGICRNQTTPVGSFPPNGWGLFDMHGNLYEWCADWYGDYPVVDVLDPQGPENGMFRVQRGGSFGNDPYNLRSASRSGYWLDTYGLRPVIIPTRPHRSEIRGD